MYRYYSAADLFVFPGFGESLGMVFLEAQSCRLPVVAIDNAGVPEVVVNGKTGILTPLKDAARFVQAAEDLILNPERRWKMGYAAEVYVRRERDLAKNYAAVEDILSDVVATKRHLNRT